MKKLIILPLVALNLSACTTSSHYQKSAQYHLKAARYYDSIGQPAVAQQEYSLAQESQKRALSPIPVMIEIFSELSEN